MPCKELSVIPHPIALNIMTINDYGLEGIWKEAILDHWNFYRKIFCKSGGKFGNSA